MSSFQNKLRVQHYYFNGRKCNMVCIMSDEDKSIQKKLSW